MCLRIFVYMAVKKTKTHELYFLFKLARLSNPIFTFNETIDFPKSRKLIKHITKE